MRSDAGIEERHWAMEAVWVFGSTLLGGIVGSGVGMVFGTFGETTIGWLSTYRTHGNAAPREMGVSVLLLLLLWGGSVSGMIGGMLGRILSGAGCGAALGLLSAIILIRIGYRSPDYFPWIDPCIWAVVAACWILTGTISGGFGGFLGRLIRDPRSL